MQRYKFSFMRYGIALAWLRFLKSQLRIRGTMFLIKKVYENELTALFKIEGEIADHALDYWSEALASLLQQSNKHVLLDCSDITFVSLNIAERLMQQMTNRIFLLNCPTAVQNLVRAAGFSTQVLE